MDHMFKIKYNKLSEVYTHLYRDYQTVQYGKPRYIFYGKVLAPSRVKQIH